MSLEAQVLSATISPAEIVWVAAKIGILLLSSLYFIFSLIVVRQINLMTEVVLTESTPYLRAFAIAHSGLALGIIILFVGFLFG